MSHSFTAHSSRAISFDEGRDLAALLVRAVSGLELSAAPRTERESVPEKERSFTPYAEVTARRGKSALVSITFWPSLVSIDLQSQPFGGCAQAVEEISDVLDWLLNSGFSLEVKAVLISDYEDHAKLVDRVASVVKGREA